MSHTKQLNIIAIVAACTYGSSKTQNLYRTSHSSHPAGTQSPTDRVTPANFHTDQSITTQNLTPNNANAATTLLFPMTVQK